MAGIEASIRSILTADSDVSALVSTRVFPYMTSMGPVHELVLLAQHSRPKIIYRHWGEYTGMAQNQTRYKKF